MRRTKNTPEVLMVEYFDRNKAQRWGKVEKELPNYFIVRRLDGDRERVLREKILEKRTVTPK